MAGRNPSFGEFVHAARKRPEGQAPDPLAVIWHATVFVSRRARSPQSQPFDGCEDDVAGVGENR